MRTCKYKITYVVQTYITVRSANSSSASLNISYLVVYTCQYAYLYSLKHIECTEGDWKEKQTQLNLESFLLSSRGISEFRKEHIIGKLYFTVLYPFWRVFLSVKHSLNRNKMFDIRFNFITFQ